VRVYCGAILDGGAVIGLVASDESAHVREDVQLVASSPARSEALDASASSAGATGSPSGSSAGG
jgi:hypothetical protein